MKQPVGILKNTSTSRFHPIVFRQAPMPSGADTDMDALRHKSRGHHIEGFDTLEQAQAWITNTEDYVDCGAMWAWDGQGTPAMVEWFPKSLIGLSTESSAA